MNDNGALRAAVTGVSGDMGQGAIKGLRAARRPVWILGLDYVPDNVGFVMADAGVAMPAVASEGYIDALIDVLRKHEIEVLLSGIDSETLPLARHRARIEAETGVRVAVSDLSVVAPCSDKLQTAAWLASLGVEPPRTISGAATIEAVEREIGYPAVVKPRAGRGSVGVVVVEGVEALVEALSGDRESQCVQAYIDGPEFTVGLLYDEGGTLRDHLVMRRWLGQGRTVRAQVETRPGIEALIEKLRQVPGARGALNLQLRVDAEGQAFVFEVNPRLSGSTAMRVALGFNDPARLAGHFVHGEPIEVAEVIRGKVYRAWMEEVVPMTNPRKTLDTLVFDCGDTLLGLDPPREVICLEALSELGCHFEVEAIERAYMCVDFAVKQNSSVLKSAEERSQFLRRFNDALAMALGIGSLSEAFDAAQRKAFSRLRRWRVASGAVEALEVLGANHRLFVLANWDSRLVALLESVGVAHHFEGIYDSQSLGVEKPDRRIFERFFEAAGVDANSALYIGNEYRADIVGSRAVGMASVLMDWHGRYGTGVDCPRLTRWEQLPDWVVGQKP